MKRPHLQLPVFSTISFISLGVMVLFLLIFPNGIGYAEEPVPPKDDGCISCHESLYYLYDTGKDFCLCVEKMTCTCCHGGNPQSLVEEEAHEGMVLYPITRDASQCQQCHQVDYQERVERFTLVAGVNDFHPTSVAVSTGHSTEVGSLTSELGNETLGRLLEPWRLAGIILGAVSLVVIAILAYRCYKADCLAKIQGR